jgi:repressor LexA
MKTINRFFEYIEFKGIKPTRFEKENSLSNGYLGTQLKRNADLGEGVINKIIDNCLDLSCDWLLTGKGSMLLTDTNLNTDKPQINKGFPLVDVKAVGGSGNMSFSFAEQDVKAYYKIPKFEHKQVDFMIEVEGSSMYPKYNSGDIVACKIIKESAFIQWNKTHVVATKDQGIIIKRILEHASTEALTMVSDNDNYPPFHVPKNEIASIALVVGVIRLE